jgi:hypothetical protein
MTTASMASHSNKCRYDNDEGTSSTLPSAPLRRRVSDKVGVEVPPLSEVAVPTLTVEKVISVPQDDNGSDDEGSDRMDLGSNDNEGSGSDDGDGEGSNDD